MTRRLCTATTLKGEPCKQPAGKAPKEVCKWHDPDSYTGRMRLERQARVADDPRTLRDLGHALLARARAAEADESWLKARSELTPEGVEKLAEICLAGSSPTIGFFLRYRRSAP